MRLYLLSLGAGLLVGAVYALLGVRSPAPPVVALVGLLGILVGEQIPPLVKAVASGSADAAGILSGQVRPHVFGHLPKGDRLANKDRLPREGRLPEDRTSATSGSKAKDS